MRRISHLIGGCDGLSGRTRRASAVFSSLVLFLLHAASLASQVKPTDIQVKSAYLYNFGRFVTWPASPGDSFAICLLGADPFGAALDKTLAGERLDGKPLVAKRIAEPRDAAGCRVVYVSESQERQLGSVLQVLAKFPVLTVSDIPHFADRGGMIQFVLDEGRVRFAVNLGAAESAGLSLSSQLLKVATEVKRQNRGGGK